MYHGCFVSGGVISLHRYKMVYHRSICRYSTAPLRTGTTAVHVVYIILFVFFNRDVFCTIPGTTARCSMFCDHGLDFRK